MCEDRGEWVEGRCFEARDRREEARVHQVINDINTREQRAGACEGLGSSVIMTYDGCPSVSN